jgi:hypothetical protein
MAGGALRGTAPDGVFRRGLARRGGAAQARLGEAGFVET